MAQRQQVPGQHPVMTLIGQAVMLHRAGDREEARNRLAALWTDPGAGAGPLHRCTIAHYLAATQDDAEAALRWDLVALAEADAAVADAAAPGDAVGRPLPGPPPAPHTARGLYPSLYLRLAGDHAALGNATAARHELGRARHAAGRLADDDHGRRVRTAIDRLERDLREGVTGRAPADGHTDQ